MYLKNPLELMIFKLTHLVTTRKRKFVPKDIKTIHNVTCTYMCIVFD